MNVFRTIWAALERLGTNLHALADTVGLTNHELRQRLMLEGPEPPPAALIEEKAQPETNGRKARASK